MPDYSELTNHNQPPFYWTRQGISLQEIEERVQALIIALNDALDGVVIEPGGGAVSSVAGRTGDITLTRDDVGLNNVDNTHDLSKPLSTAMTTALAGKVGLNATTGFIPIALLPPGSVVVVRKDAATGFWPSGWANDQPSYSGGSTTAAVRPTDRADVTIIWTGPDPDPVIVTSGTGGARNEIDSRDVRP